MSVAQIAADDDDGSTDEERTSTSVRPALRPIDEKPESRVSRSRSFTSSRRASAPHALETSVSVPATAGPFSLGAVADGAQRLARLLDLGHAPVLQPKVSGSVALAGAQIAASQPTEPRAPPVPISQPTQKAEQTASRRNETSESEGAQARHVSGARIARLESEAWGLELDLRERGSFTGALDIAQSPDYGRLRLNTAGTALELSGFRPASDTGVATLVSPPLVATDASDNADRLLHRTQSTSHQWDTSLIMGDEPGSVATSNTKSQPPPLLSISLPLWKKRLCVESMNSPRAY